VNSDQLQIEWVAWLSAYPWEYFLTITFRDLVPMHRQESVMHAVGQSIVKGFDTDRLFLVSEAHSSQTLHLHGLFKARAHDSRFDRVLKALLWEHLFKVFGRSKVEKPRRATDVASYATKYCLKSGGYYQIWGPSGRRGELHGYS